MLRRKQRQWRRIIMWKLRYICRKFGIWSMNGSEPTSKSREMARALRPNRTITTIDASRS